MGNTACGAKRRQALANRRLGAAAAADSNIAASSQYSDTSGQYSSGYGGGGGGGYVYAMMCPEGIDQDIALAATAAALAVGIYVVYRQVKYYNISLLDKAPNYVFSWVHYPKEIVHSMNWLIVGYVTKHVRYLEEKNI